MTDFLKSPLNLGVMLNHEFCDPTQGVLPIVQGLLRSEDDQACVGKLWGLPGGKVLSKITNISATWPTSVHHQGDWKFLLRSAQCAALADQRLEARLVDVGSSIEDPHGSAMETIIYLGIRAVNLAREEIDEDFTAPEPATTWSHTTKQKIAELCIKPQFFKSIFSDFAAQTAQERLPDLLNGNPPVSMRVLYLATTAAAYVGHELRIDFVPLEQPAGE